MDINQGNPTTLTLDELQIYTHDDADVDNLTELVNNGTLHYDLDGAGDDQIFLDYSLFSGSGNGFDMFAYIPTTDFAGALDTDYVYLYALFGDTGGIWASNDGFEEWAIRLVGRGNQPVPEPTTVLLLGSGLVGLALYGRKRFRKEAGKVS